MRVDGMRRAAPYRASNRADVFCAGRILGIGQRAKRPSRRLSSRKGVGKWAGRLQRGRWLGRREHDDHAVLRHHAMRSSRVALASRSKGSPWHGRGAHQRLLVGDIISPPDQEAASMIIIF